MKFLINNCNYSPDKIECMSSFFNHAYPCRQGKYTELKAFRGLQCNFVVNNKNLRSPIVMYYIRIIAI